MTNSSFKELQQLVHSLILVFAAMTMCFYGVNYHRLWSKFDNTKGGTKKHHMDKGKESAIVSLH